MLEENVALLQARIQELEDPNIAARRVFLSDPYEAFRQSERRERIFAGVGRDLEANMASTEQLNTEEPTQDIIETL